ncbi:hypothetical protein [Rhodoferax sp.]|uniref:hypothetical protein n=1 Tax=Rhodoferax sp. TaxID=50421 RepID=UPI00374DF4E9
MNMPTPCGPDRIHQKEKAARVVAHPAAEALFNAAKHNNCIDTAPANRGGFPAADAFSLAMRWAQAMVQAVTVGTGNLIAVCGETIQPLADLPVAEMYLKQVEAA